LGSLRGKKVIRSDDPAVDVRASDYILGSLKERGVVGNQYSTARMERQIDELQEVKLAWRIPGLLVPDNPIVHSTSKPI
jgi:hypothetical protein